MSDPERKRAEAMAEARFMGTLGNLPEPVKQSAILRCLSDAAMMDAYFAHTRFLIEAELHAGFLKQVVRFSPEPEPRDER